MNGYLPPIINGPILIVLSEPGSGDIIEEKLMSGKDGVVLRQLLKDAGLKPEECSYALWDYFPGPFYKPELIIAMGNDALKGLTKKSGIKKYRGQTLPLHESYGFTCNVYPTYSVQDLRSVPTYRRTIVADLRNTQKGESDTVAYTMWEND